jgi:hypothetical protein
VCKSAIEAYSSISMELIIAETLAHRAGGAEFTGGQHQSDCVSRPWVDAFMRKDPHLGKIRARTKKTASEPQDSRWRL